MNYYKLSPEDQKRSTIRNLLHYIKDYVYPYHPYFRKTCKENGLNVSDLNTYEDFIKLPVISKVDYRKDPRAFILQPKFPGREDKIPYDTEKIHLKPILKYIVQAVLNHPPEYGHLYRKMHFLKDKVGRRAAWEWMPIHFHASAGSTGDPTPAVYTLHDIKNVLPELSSSALIQPDIVEPDRPTVRWDTKNLNIFPGTPHLAFFQAVLAKFTLGLSSFDTCGGKVIPTDRQIEIFAQGEFNSLTAIPSYLVYWMRRAVEMKKEGKIKTMPHFEAVALGGEPASPKMKEYFKELAKELGGHPNFKVVEGYGMTETKWAFTECREASGIHLHPKFYFWEILHPETLKPVKDGEEGVLCFSHINWRGTVFIRYNTGDLLRGGLQWKRCEYCGYTFPIMYGPISRAQKDFTKLKGTRVALLDLIGTVRDTPGVRNFQVILDKETEGDEFSKDILRIVVVTHSDIDKTKITNDLKRRVKEVTEVTPDDIVFETDVEKFEAKLFERTGIKADYIIDKRPVHI